MLPHSIGMNNSAELLRTEIMRAAKMKSLETQGDLAAALGLSATYLSDILRNRRRLTPDLVNKAIAALGVSPIRGQRWHRLGAEESGWHISPSHGDAT